MNAINSFLADLRIGARPARPDGGGARALHTPAQMRQLLQRERLRADRLDGRLSLTVFRLLDTERPPLRQFSRIVLENCRVTDEVGMGEDGQLWVLLCQTSADGAGCFATRIQRLARESSIAVVFTTFSYPTAGWPDERDHEMGDATAARPLEVVLREPTSVPKRIMDLVGATICLVLALPVMLVAAGLIRLSSRGPAIFQQRRAGWGGVPFTIFKFRTMSSDAEQRKASLRQLSEQDGPAFKMTRDPRVTWIGRFLRVTSLDELPQFWNVLVGNMSLVGPRPLPLEEAAATARWQRRRVDVLPGITCIWQVFGRSRVSFDEWMRMDMKYIRTRSLLRDVAILLLTVPVVIIRRGAH